MQAGLPSRAVQTPVFCPVCAVQATMYVVSTLSRPTTGAVFLTNDRRACPHYTCQVPCGSVSDSDAEVSFEWLMN